MLNLRFVKIVQIRSSSGLDFPIFRPSTGKYRLEKTPHWDTFNTVLIDWFLYECNPFLDSQLVFTCSKSAIEILEKGVKYVQS